VIGLDEAVPNGSRALAGRSTARANGSGWNRRQPRSKRTAGLTGRSPTAVPAPHGPAPHCRRQAPHQHLHRRPAGRLGGGQPTEQALHLGLVLFRNLFGPQRGEAAVGVFDRSVGEGF
jgi:hypothetical protein